MLTWLLEKSRRTKDSRYICQLIRCVIIQLDISIFTIIHAFIFFLHASALNTYLWQCYQAVFHVTGLPLCNLLWATRSGARQAAPHQPGFMPSCRIIDSVTLQLPLTLGRAMIL